VSMNYRCDVCDARVEDRGVRVKKNVEYEKTDFIVLLSVELGDTSTCELCERCLGQVVFRLFAQNPQS